MLNKFKIQTDEEVIALAGGDDFALTLMSYIGKNEFSFLKVEDEATNETDGSDDFEEEIGTCYQFKHLLIDEIGVHIIVTDHLYNVWLMKHMENGEVESIDNYPCERQLNIEEAYKELLSEHQKI